MFETLFDRGCSDGYEYAVGICFNPRKPTPPYFNTAEEEAEYLAGFDYGFGCVVD